jgi:hypothetical protein
MSWDSGCADPAAARIPGEVWNTRYLDAAVADLKRAGHPVKEEDEVG